MTLIEWDKSFEVGVKEMDEQHRKLVEMLNHVYELLEKGKREEAKRYFIHEILNYFETHFNAEEEFMKSINYPDLENHLKAHENFRKVMNSLISKIEEGKEHEFREAVALAWGWLYSHIQKVDKKYGEYYRNINT